MSQRTGVLQLKLRGLTLRVGSEEYRNVDSYLQLLLSIFMRHPPWRAHNHCGLRFVGRRRPNSSSRHTQLAGVEAWLVICCGLCTLRKDQCSAQPCHVAHAALAA